MLRLEGLCSVALGLALALVAFPGLVVDYAAPWVGLLFAPLVIVALGGYAVFRRGASPARPGEWLTTRPLDGARPGRSALLRRPLVRRLEIETGAWIVGGCAWVILTGSSGLLFFGTGLASIAYGLLQAVPSARRVAAVEAAAGETFVVARRPGFGTPELGVRPGPGGRERSGRSAAGR